MQKFDSLIFDMDGTLWDAVDSYCKVWERTSEMLGADLVVTRDDLLRCMGLPIDAIYGRLVTDPNIDRAAYLDLLDRNENEMMPRLGGRLYDGVADGIRALARSYRLFMVSNCGADGLHNFMRFAGLADCFTDSLAHGETGLGKRENIAIIAQRNSLKAPLYVGDTQGDCDAAHAAGVKMAHVTYGFGTCRDADFSFHSFPEFTRAILDC